MCPLRLGERNTEKARGGVGGKSIVDDRIRGFCGMLVRGEVKKKNAGKGISKGGPDAQQKKGMGKRGPNGP